MTRHASMASLHDAGMAADATSGGVVAFGGSRATPDGGRAPSALTQLWDGRAWHPVAPETSPPARQHPLLVADHAHGRTLLFGGIAATTVPAPHAWSRGPTAQEGRAVPAMTATLSPIVDLTDGWSWNGVAWTPIPGYHGHARGVVTYHPALRTPVLVGEVRAAARSTIPAPVATWRWDETGWQLHTEEVPGDPLTSMAVDPPSGRLIGLAAATPVVPGRSAAGSPRRRGPGRRGYARIWVFDGHGWTIDVALAPPERVSGVLVADEVTGTLLLITAFGHTWALRGDAWMSVGTPQGPPQTATDAGSRMQVAATPSGVLLVVTGPTVPDQTWTFDGRGWRAVR